ncbi:MAG: SRPBCC family protein [Cyanobacteria bacterium SW_9_44_58]|nr:MAG: SRPBCC family protein [Cyanobacteria bacterium SW_9_44_58]
MKDYKVFEQSIQISASATMVEKCISDRELMHRWLNPRLRCEPVGEWDTQLGSRSRFIIDLPGIQPTLNNTVVEREPGLIVWEFSGFFQGRDRWECQPNDQGTKLINRFEFKVPNPVVKFGFELLAAGSTKQEMSAQLRRLKRVAEALYIKSGYT